MPGVFTLIGQSYAFCRKQTALTGVFFWLIFLPMTGISWLTRFIVDAEKIGGKASSIILMALCQLVLGILLVWGIACILVVGCRLIGAKAGRSRTSFKAVRTEAKSFIIPLILTGLLRSVLTMLWGILLVIPGIIYSVRTVFYSIVIVNEGIDYRPALHRSRDIARGHTVELLIKIVLMSILLFLPSPAFVALCERVTQAPTALIVIDLIGAALNGVALMLFLLATILLYGALRPATGPITNTIRKTSKK